MNPVSTGIVVNVDFDRTVALYEHGELTNSKQYLLLF